MKKVIFICLAFMMISSGCSIDKSSKNSGNNSTATNNDIDIEQEIVFIYQYTNWASGYQNYGYVIDRNGNKKAFDLSELEEDYSSNTEKFIAYLEKLDDTSIKGTVDINELKANYLLLKKINISSKEYTEKANGNDMGQKTLYGVIYNKDGTHTLIEISSVGDFIRENKDKNAIKINSWFASKRSTN